MELHSAIFLNGQRQLLSTGAPCAIGISPLILPVIPDKLNNDTTYNAAQCGPSIALAGVTYAFKNGCWCARWNPVELAGGAAMPIYGYVISQLAAPAAAPPTGVLWGTWFGPLPSGVTIPPPWAVADVAPYRNLTAGETFWVIPELEWCCDFDDCSPAGCNC